MILVDVILDNIAQLGEQGKTVNVIQALSAGSSPVII